jgi:hypothetical protein
MHAPAAYHNTRFGLRETQMSIQAFVVRLVALAAVIFIAVLVWRVGTQMIFDDAADRTDWEAAAPHDATAIEDAALERSAVVSQQADGTIRLTPENAGQLSPQIQAQTRNEMQALVGWRSADDSATWKVRIESVGDGYFRAQLRYRSQQSVRMEASVAEKRLAIWTLKETSLPEVEEKFIRLTRAGDYELKLGPLGTAETLELYEILLMPRK